MRPVLLLAVLGLMAPFAQAQRPDPLTPDGENMTTPPSWVVRFDAPHGHGDHADHADHAPTVGADSTADVFFVNMTPGWHVTTGPRAIFYHPDATASGDVRVRTMMHLFDPGERREAHGLFMGGQNLDGDDLAYDYFLIREGGEFLIKRRRGDETETLQDWTAHDAIRSFADGDGSPVENVLEVVAQGDDVAFLVNGTEVARLPRTDVQTDGIAGLRINHALNLHVEDFAIERLGS